MSDRSPSLPGLAAGAAGAAAAGIGDLVSESLILKMPTPLDRAHQAVGRALLGASVPLPRRPNPATTRAVRHIALSPAASPAQVAFCERLVLGCRPGVRAGFGRELSRLDLDDAVGRLAVPTLVLAAERDRLTPPRHSERLAASLPRLDRLEHVSEVGHMAPIEDPDAVNEALRGLARRHPTGAGERVEEASDVATG